MNSNLAITITITLKMTVHAEIQVRITVTNIQNLHGTVSNILKILSLHSSVYNCYSN